MKDHDLQVPNTDYLTLGPRCYAAYVTDRWSAERDTLGVDQPSKIGTHVIEPEGIKC